MRILVVQESDWLTKGPHQQHHLMDRLSLKSHQILVIDHEIMWRTQPRKELFFKRKVFNNVSRVDKRAKVRVVRPAFVRIPLLDVFALIFSHAREIDRQIRDFKPEVIVGFGILNNYLAMILAKRNRIPFVSYWIDTYDTLIPYKRFRFLAKILERALLKEADSVIVINKQLRDFVIGLGADPEKTSVVSAGIDFYGFSRKIDGTPIRKEYGIKDNDLVLFYMGTVFSFSGLKEVALDLASQKHENRNIKLLVVGKTRTEKLHHELTQIQSECGLDSDFILAGRQPYEKIPVFLAAADICLLPAYNNEVMQNIVPIKIYEYMGSGKPIICTKLPGVMKEFGQGNGIEYVDKPSEVMKKVLELIDSKVSLANRGMMGRSYVAKLDWDNIVEDFSVILEKTVDNHK